MVYHFGIPCIGMLLAPSHDLSPAKQEGSLEEDKLLNITHL